MQSHETVKIISDNYLLREDLVENQVETSNNNKTKNLSRKPLKQMLIKYKV